MERIAGLLGALRKKRVSARYVLDELKKLPYQDLGFAKVDTHRHLRRGFPEVVYARGKTNDEIEKISKGLLSEKSPLVITRANSKTFNSLKKTSPGIKYNSRAGIIYKRVAPHKRRGLVVIVTAGTSDIKVAAEARVTLEIMGNRAKLIEDAGAAGIHRIFKFIPLLEKARVIIVIAGMEGALASVVSGLVSKPVIAVPTSTGYGASFKGITPLLAMLSGCSPGVSVVNIDNGFGAAYFASLINRR